MLFVSREANVMLLHLAAALILQSTSLLSMPLPTKNGIIASCIMLHASELERMIIVLLHRSEMIQLFLTPENYFAIPSASV